MLQPWRVTRDGVALRVRVTPRSSREGVDGIEDTAEGPALKVRVRAVPEDGAANAAVSKALADWLGVAKRDVTLIAGGKSRVKIFEISGRAEVLDALLVARFDGKGQADGGSGH